MTNAEAIEILKRDRDLCRFNPMTGERVPMSKDCEDSANALDVAISALEPKDVESLDWERRMEEERKLAAMWGYGIDPDRLTDIIDAEKEGRLLVLPCKVGDMVYEHDFSVVYAHTLRRIIFDCDGIAFDESAIGKSIYLSREEAEAALKERDDDA